MFRAVGAPGTPPLWPGFQYLYTLLTLSPDRVTGTTAPLWRGFLTASLA